MNSEIFVSEIKDVRPEIMEALRSLIPQLSTTSLLPTYIDLEKIINSKSTKLFIAFDEKIIVGSLTLVIFQIPTGVRAWIEDVIVDENYRKKGIGKLLCKKAIETAKENQSRTIDLTSRPGRIEANRFYKSLGFKVRNTNVYRINLG